jgi:hypothetical protein
MKQTLLRLAWLPVLALATCPAPGRDDLPKVDPAKPKLLKAELARLIEVFDALEVTGIKGKAWVVVETGSEKKGDHEVGWLLADGPTELTLLGRDGERQTIKKPKAGSERSTDDGTERLAWKIRPADYARFCKKFLADGIPVWKREENNLPGVYHFVRERNQLTTHVVAAARHACWAQLRGHEELALELRGHAQVALNKYQGTYVADKDEPLDVFVANQIATGYRIAAVFGGHGGAARPELLERWQFLFKIPHHRFREDAKAMAGYYESLIAEDKAWKEPDEKALAKMTVQEKVDYWMYHLRDLDLYQRSDPGMCYVVCDDERFAAFLMGQNPDSKKPNAAMELKKLGMDALPEIIAHLDDARPTRCEGHWRSYAPESYYLLRYGDCCQQIFECISGHTLYERTSTVGYPIVDGKGKECQAAAEKWLREYKEKGEKQMLIEGTAAGDRDSSTQAERLVRKYPDAAFEPLTKGIRNSSKGWILAPE